MIDRAVFIISLDVELLRGAVLYSFHKVVTLLKSDIEKVRGCIDILLNLFQKHNIPATWAVVRHLFLDHCECEDGIPHKDMPRFKKDWYSVDPCAIEYAYEATVEKHRMFFVNFGIENHG